MTCSSERLEEICKDLPNVFGIAYENFIVGYDADGKDHDRTLRQVMQMFQQEYLNPNKSKCIIKKYYEQVQTAAMGSPISPIVANLFMKDFEARDISTSSEPPCYGEGIWTITLPSEKHNTETSSRSR